MDRASYRREFDRFVEDIAPRLLRTSYLMTRNLSQAEDMAQEALFRAAKQWPRIRRMDFPQAYVRRILVNLVLREASRQSTSSVTTAEDDETASFPDQRAEHELLKIDQRSEILWLLDSLPPSQRLVVVLRYFEELTEGEIAEHLGWPIGTVKSAASRALERLRRTLESSSEGELRAWRKRRSS
jgi:RNA polymerase sigma-70 factor (sigma-E family)